MTSASVTPAATPDAIEWQPTVRPAPKQREYVAVDPGTGLLLKVANFDGAMWTVSVSGFLAGLWVYGAAGSADSLEGAQNAALNAAVILARAGLQPAR
jgi:hypothetical protein